MDLVTVWVTFENACSLQANPVSDPSDLTEPPSYNDIQEWHSSGVLWALEVVLMHPKVGLSMTARAHRKKI